MKGDKGKRLASVVFSQDGADDPTAQPKLDRTTQTRIGDQLRAMYDDLVHQPVPDKFRDLLDQLEQGAGPEKTR